MGFQQGLSGLNAAAQNLDVIGNNVANANTSGFKSSRAEFADLYANAINGGSGRSQIGIGTSVAAVSHSFNQGSLTMTNAPLDVAINGNGFFRLNDDGAVSYSRNGQFTMDKDGYLVNAKGDRLTGYGVDANGRISPGAVTDLKVTATDIAPQVTSGVDIVANLDSRATAITAPAAPTPAIDITDSSTFHNATSVTIYDGLGSPHVMTTYYVKRAANTWDVYGSFDNAVVGGAATPTRFGTLNFTTTGSLDTTAGMSQGGTPATGLPWTLPAMAVAGAPALQPSLDFGDTTQYGNNFSIASIAQDGFTSGRLSGFTISPEGEILGRYSNGQSRAQGQIALASFTNPHGLQNLGNNGYAETPESGAPIVNTPSSGTLGVVTSGALEDSNVDLTSELVSLITAQRVYQANAQTIKAQDTILQTIVNLR